MNRQRQLEEQVVRAIAVRLSDPVNLPLLLPLPLLLRLLLLPVLNPLNLHVNLENEVTPTTWSASSNIITGIKTSRRLPLLHSLVEVLQPLKKRKKLG